MFAPDWQVIRSMRQVMRRLAAIRRVTIQSDPARALARNLISHRHGSSGYYLQGLAASVRCYVK
jgi:hypothetical protein